MTETEQLADVIALVLHAEMAPILAKLAVLEARPAVAPESLDAVKDIASALYIRVGALEARAAVPGKDGKDADPALIQAAVDQSVSKAVALIPAPKDGASVTVADVAPLIATEVTKAVAAIPVPKDGASVTVDDVVPLIAAEVSKAVATIPTPKDGASVTVADVAPLIATEVSKAVATIPTPKDGASVTVADVAPLIATEVSKAVAAIPAPKDGASVTVADVAPLIATEVSKAVAEIPAPQDGHSPTVEDVAPFLVDQIQKQISALPLAKDGVGFTGALINRDGHLVLTLSDGSTKDVGLVIGKDGDPGAPGHDADPGLPGKDGAVGLGFGDLDLVFDEARGYLLRCQREDQFKEWAVPIPFDAGVWQFGRVYPRGAGVTVKGAWWIAQAPTSARPGDDTPDSRAWRLSVKGGRDGKPGKDGKDGNDV